MSLVVVRRLALALALVLAASCTSPTLPLPPPALPTVSVGSSPDSFRLRSDRGALPNALIVVINRNETLSRDERVDATLADVEGSWEIGIKGKVGDLVDVSQEDGTARSAPVTVQLR